MTNEEKIKAMSREEMAEAMAGKIGLPEYCAAVCPEHMDCVRCAFEWLGEEAGRYRREACKSEEGGH